MSGQAPTETQAQGVRGNCDTLSIGPRHFTRMAYVQFSLSLYSGYNLENVHKIPNLEIAQLINDNQFLDFNSTNISIIPCVSIQVSKCQRLDIDSYQFPGLGLRSPY